jgi:hypothetical protein
MSWAQALHRRATPDPLGLVILAAAASEVLRAARQRTGAGAGGAREEAASQGVVAATLLASAGNPSWRVPTLASASLHHFVRAGRVGRAVDVVWAAALGGLLCEARRAERWDA